MKQAVSLIQNLNENTELLLREHKVDRRKSHLVPFTLSLPEESTQCISAIYCNVIFSGKCSLYLYLLLPQ